MFTWLLGKLRRGTTPAVPGPDDLAAVLRSGVIEARFPRAGEGATSEAPQVEILRPCYPGGWLVRDGGATAEGPSDDREGGLGEEGALLQAIREAPHDEASRLVYADWLEERGDVRGELLRIEIQLGRTDAGDPGYTAALARWVQLRDLVPADWLSGLGLRVNGLPLPPELVDLLATRRWGPATVYRRGRRGVACPYNYDQMREETSNVCFSLQWLGRPDPKHPPGDIDPRLSVMIADRGVGEDAPFVLDYRVSFGRPRILLYRWGVSKGPSGNRWVEVAPHFPAFWGQLRG